MPSWHSGTVSGCTRDGSTFDSHSGSDYTYFHFLALLTRDRGVEFYLSKRVALKVS